MAPIYGRIRRETKPYRIASCPACSGNARNITMDKQFPELIDLYSEDNEIPLSEVTGNWQKKYIWVCKKHGKFTSVLSSMVRAIRSGNNGCPFCHGTQVKAEESFGTLYPELVEEWDSSNQKTPFEVTAGSSYEAAWKCSKGHTWKAAVSERANGGKLCPECFPNGNRPSFNAMHPDLKKFFCKENPVQFEKGVISDYTPYLWKAECSHAFTDSFALIHERGFRCPYCADLKVLAGYNDFQTRYPEYSSSFDEKKNKISASEVTCRESDSTRWWKCQYGHAYQRSVRTQIAYKGVCPVCSLHVLQTGVNDAETVYPLIRELWDEEANHKKPSEVSANRLKIFYFQCDKGHRFRSSITVLEANQFKCLVCENLRMDPDFTSLKAVYPELAEEWSPNNDKTPYEVKYDSRERHLWVCKTCRCDYLASIEERLTDTKGCLVCKDVKVAAGINDLASVDPQLASEWSPRNERTPDTVLRTQAYTAYWICPDCGGEYPREVRDRYAGDHACPYCKGLRPLQGVNDLQTLEPELAKEWSSRNTSSPSSVRRDSSSTYLWICKNCGHEYAAQVKNRYLGDKACQYCYGTFVETGFNDLKTTDPELAEEWSPNNDRPASEAKKSWSNYFLWICPDCGYEYGAPPSGRSLGDKYCPVCYPRGVVPGINDLETVDPELAKEWAPSNDKPASQIWRDAGIYSKWICNTCGQEYRAIVRDRFVGDNACSICAGTVIKTGFNDLQTTDPDLAEEWAPDNRVPASKAYKNWRNLYLWICRDCANEYTAAPFKRYAGDKACPYCNNRKVMPGMNSLADIKPELISEWSSNNDIAPDEVLATSSRTVLWKCPDCCGEYSYPVKDRQTGDCVCPYCNDKKVLPGYNSVQAKNPDLIKSEWCKLQNGILGIDPDQIMDTDNRKVWWKCKECGSNYLLSVKQRLLKEKRGHNACTFCNGRRIKSVHFL